MQVCAHHLEQVLQLAVVTQTMTFLVELPPIGGVKQQMIKCRLISNSFVEPCEITRYAQVVLGGSHNCHVIDGVPWSNPFTRHIVGGEMLVHVLEEPVFDQPAQCFGIEH